MMKRAAVVAKHFCTSSLPSSSSFSLFAAPCAGTAPLPPRFSSSSSATPSSDAINGGSRPAEIPSDHSLINTLMERRILEQKQKDERVSRGRVVVTHGVEPSPVSNSAVPEIKTKHPRDSWVQLDLPFSTDLRLRDSYTNFFKDVRIGKVLEDLDALAGEVAYKHSDGFSPTRPLTIVTASVDRIDMMGRTIPSDRDLRLQGCVSWVGSSSMETRVEVLSSAGEGKWDTVMVATFNMVALHRHSRKAAIINRLQPSTDAEKEMFAEGEAKRAQRKSAAAKSMLLAPMTEEEKNIIHELFLESKRMRNEPDLASNYTWMEETIFQKSAIMHPQERNIHNKVFGGHLLRESFELAWITASAFSRTRPVFVALDDNHFLKAVEIGSLVNFSAQVVYTSDTTLQIRVLAEVMDIERGTRESTNCFHFEFQVPKTTKVMPRTLEEALLYLDGKRVDEKGEQKWRL